MRQLFLCLDKAWVHTSCFSIGDSRSVSVRLLAAFQQSHSMRCTCVVNPSKDLTVFRSQALVFINSVFCWNQKHAFFIWLAIAIFYRVNKIISREHLHNQFYFLSLYDTMQHINMYVTSYVSPELVRIFCIVCYLQILNDGCSILLEALCIGDLELLRIYSGTHLHVYYKRNSRINTDWW